MLKIVILCACLAYGWAEPVTVADCMPDGDQTALPNPVMTVSDCADPNRCELIRNTNHSITITFVPTRDTHNLKMTVYGKVLRVRVPYLKNVDLCPNTAASDGTTCSQESGLKEGKTYTINYLFYIRSQFPEWRVPVDFEIWDSEARLGCFRVNVEIKCNVNTEENCRREN